MRTGEAGNILGVDGRTVKNWIDHPALSRFFSITARGEHGGTHRILTDSDLVILNTVRHLRHLEKKEWEDIAKALDDGLRESDIPQNAASIDTRTVPLQQAEQSAKAMATLAERDAALARVQQLESQMEKLQDKNDALMRELQEMNRQIGKLEGLLEAYQKKTGE